tara:strand:+ start:202 stop:570 length:369 start_codon:yes stop_codon:yes gene_type:complete
MNIPRLVKRKRMVKSNAGLGNQTRNLVATIERENFNVNNPVTPITCAGTSFDCDVAGSGNTPIVSVDMHPDNSDFLATPISDAGITGVSFQPDFILNWNNNSVETQYTKDSLKNTYGFENFQ